MKKKRHKKVCFKKEKCVAKRRKFYPKGFTTLQGGWSKTSIFCAVIVNILRHLLRDFTTSSCNFPTCLHTRHPNVEGVNR